MSEVITSPFHAFEHYPTNRIFGFANSNQSKVTPDDMWGVPVFHYSIPNVQEFADGALEVGSSVKSDKMLVSEPCVLISKLNPRKATIALAYPQEELTVASTEFVPISTNSERDNRYLYWVLNSGEVTRYLSSLVSSATNSHQRVDPSEIIGLRVPWPSEPERHRIANYLDRETTEIDAMIDKLGELAETLRARRNDVIKRAIASDRSIAIGLMVDVTLGKMLQPVQKKPTDVQRPYLRAAHVQPGGVIDFDVDEKQMWFSETEVQALDLRAGDTVVVEGGAGFGRSAHLTEDLPGWGFQNSIIRLRGSAEDGRYLMYSLHAALSSGAIHVACNAATFAHFTAEKVEAFRVPFHEPAERARIADHLDAVTSKIDAMLSKVAQLKDLLTERRAALITDVVTGRKDVA